jgi:hypothetical protein
MIGRSNNIMQSNKVRGTLWIIAAFPMIAGPALFAGNTSISAIGLMFLIFGIVALRRK